MRLLLSSLVAVCLCSCGKKDKPTEPAADGNAPPPSLPAPAKPEVTALLCFWDSTVNEHVYTYGDGTLKGIGQQRKLIENYFYVYATGGASNPPTSNPAPPKPQPDKGEEVAIDYVRSVNGEVVRDEDAPGKPVVEVKLMLRDVTDA